MLTKEDRPLSVIFKGEGGNKIWKNLMPVSQKHHRFCLQYIAALDVNSITIDPVNNPLCPMGGVDFMGGRLLLNTDTILKALLKREKSLGNSLSE